MEIADELPLEKKESRTSKLIKLLIKLIVTVLCFWYISTKIDFSKAWDALLKANWWWLFLAVLSFIILGAAPLLRDTGSHNPAAGLILSEKWRIFVRQLKDLL